MDLRNKVALVTGGAVRIGQMISLALAEAGCDIFLHYGFSAAKAVETKNAIDRLGREAVSYSADLANSRAVRSIIPTALDAFGRVDILINNAAVFPEDDHFIDLNESEWERIININAKAPFLLCQDFAKQLNGRQGKIININDARIPFPRPDHFAYRLAKRALWDMTEILAVDLAPNVTVNQVALGAILPPVGKPQRYLEMVAESRVPLKRPGSPRIVAENVLHLLQQDFLTGVTLEIDGGEYI